MGAGDVRPVGTGSRGGGNGYRRGRRGLARDPDVRAALVDGRQSAPPPADRPRSQPSPCPACFGSLFGWPPSSSSLWSSSPYPSNRWFWSKMFAKGAHTITYQVSGGGRSATVTYETSRGQIVSQ